MSIPAAALSLRFPPSQALSAYLKKHPATHHLRDETKIIAAVVECFANRTYVYTKINPYLKISFAYNEEILDAINLIAEAIHPKECGANGLAHQIYDALFDSAQKIPYLSSRL